MLNGRAFIIGALVLIALVCVLGTRAAAARARLEADRKAFYGSMNVELYRRRRDAERGDRCN